MATTDHEAYIALQDRCDDLEAKLAAVTAERDEAQAVIDGVREVRRAIEVRLASNAWGVAEGIYRRALNWVLNRLNKVDGL